MLSMDRATETAARARRCPFCEEILTRRNTSREHIVARWVRDVDIMKRSYTLDARAGKRRTVSSTPFQPIGDSLFIMTPEVREAAQKSMHITQLTVAVCVDCNTEWMSRTEEAVKPVLEPLMEGVVASIDPASFSLISRWAMKTSWAFQQTDVGTSMITPAQLRDLRNERPPRWVRVAAARFDDPTRPMMIYEAFQAWPRDGSLFPSVQLKVGRSLMSLGYIALMLQWLDRPCEETVLSHQPPPYPWIELAGAETVTLHSDAVSYEQTREYARTVAVTNNGVVPW